MDQQSSSAVPSVQPNAQQTNPTIPSSATSGNASLTDASSTSRGVRARSSTSQGDLSSARRQSTISDKSSSRGSKDSLKSRVEQAPKLVRGPSASDQLLDLLQTELKSIRELITCKICYSPLYEPYTTSCGHTFCYNCFCKTFEPHKPKNCPECRTNLHTAPAPAFTLREITRRLIKQPELLAEDETIEGHQAMVEEHEQLVKKDRETSRGIFRGLFQLSRQSCPYCTEDMYHGSCVHCGYNTNGDEDFSDQESYGGFDGLSEHTISDDQDEDFDMEDVDHGFDMDLPEEAYEEDAWGNPLFLDGLELDIPPHEQHAMIHEYLASMNRFSSDSTNANTTAYIPASHSMAASLNTRRRSYAPSTASDYVDTEMNTVPEEEEEEEDDEDEDDDGADSSSREETSSAATESNDGFESEDDMSTDSEVSFQPYALASGPGYPTTTSQFTTARELQRESRSQSTQSEASTTQSTPIPVRSSNGTPSRRRQRESTPTSSIGQPRQRRRIGSVINLAAANLQQANASSVSRQSSVQNGSTSENLSVSSEDEGSGESSDDDADGYVSLDDDTDQDSDGAETTVGWEEASNTTQQTLNSTTPTVDGPSSARSLSNLRNIQSDVLRSSRQQSLASTESSAHEESDVGVSDVNHGVSSRPRVTVRPIRFEAIRQPSTEMELENHGESLGTSTPQRDHGVSLQARPVDASIRLMFDQHRQDSRGSPRTPSNGGRYEHPAQLREGLRTPGTNWGRPRSVNRSRTTTPMQNIMNASPNNTLASLVHQQNLAAYDTRRRQAVPNASPANRGPQNPEQGSPLNNSSPARHRASGPPHFLTPGIFATMDDYVDLADGRAGQRPPSAAGRRTPLARTSLGPPIQIANPDLNAARNWQTAQNPGNPFMRHRPSRRQLNNQGATIAVRPVPSITALRNQASRGSMRNNVPVPSNRPPSRSQSRNQQRSLNHTPSMIHLPQSQAAQQLASHSAYTNIAAPRARVYAAQPSDNISQRINDAMDVRAAMIARRQQGIGEDSTTSRHPAPLQQLTDLQTLRITSTNPFRGQQINANNWDGNNNHRHSAGPNQGYGNYTSNLVGNYNSNHAGNYTSNLVGNYTSNLVGNNHGQRLTTRRSRGNLAHGPPPGIIFSTTNAAAPQYSPTQNRGQSTSNISASSTTGSNTNASASSPRLARQRSRGGMASIPQQNPSFVPASMVHGSGSQERAWAGTRTVAGAIGGSGRQDARLSTNGAAVPRA